MAHMPLSSYQNMPPSSSYPSHQARYPPHPPFCSHSYFSAFTVPQQQPWWTPRRHRRSESSPSSSISSYPLSFCYQYMMIIIIWSQCAGCLLWTEIQTLNIHYSAPCIYGIYHKPQYQGVPWFNCHHHRCCCRHRYTIPPYIKNHNNEIVEFTTSTEIPGAPSNLRNPELLQSKVAQSNPQPHFAPYLDHHYQEQDYHDHDQVTAINNINAMLAQATSSIRNENEAVHNLQGRPSPWIGLKMERILNDWSSQFVSPSPYLGRPGLIGSSLGGAPSFLVIFGSFFSPKQKSSRYKTFQEWMVSEAKKFGDNSNNCWSRC